MTERSIVKAALLEYLGGERSRTVACLTGPWGTGKTHLWNEVEQELHSQGRRTAYLSLFGIPGVASAKIALFNAVFVGRMEDEDSPATRRYKHAKDWGGRVVRGLLEVVDKKVIGTDFFAKNIDLAWLVPSRTVICLDDLERVSDEFRLEDVLGFANSLAERGGCRVLLIMNEEHLEQRYTPDRVNLVRAYRERVVHRILRMETDLREVVPFLVKDHSIDLPEATRDVVVETLLRAHNYNLRTAVRAMENASELRRASVPVLDAADARMIAALTSEQALGLLRKEDFYDFHPIIFGLRREGATTDAETLERQAFFNRYFESGPYRPSGAIYGLLRDGLLDAAAYRRERDVEAGLAVTRLGRLMRRVDGGDHWFLNDGEARGWLVEIEEILSTEPEISAESVNTVYSVVATICRILDQPVPASVDGAAEAALVDAARRMDTTFGIRRSRGQSVLPDRIREAYENELSASMTAALRLDLMSAILDRDLPAFIGVIQRSPPRSAETVLEAEILSELHVAMIADPRFWFSALGEVSDRLRNSPMRGRLLEYLGDAAAQSPERGGRHRALELLRGIEPV